MALAAVFAAPAAALTKDDPYARILQDIQGDGHINPCDYTDADLAQAFDQVPRDVAKNAPDITREIQSALAAHAKGDCGNTSAPESEGDTPSASGGAVPPQAAGGDAGPPGTATTPTTPTTPTIPTTPTTPTVPTTPTTPTVPGTTSTTTTPTVPAPAAGGPTPPGSATPASDTADTSIAWLPLIVLGAIALVALLVAAFAALSRALGWEPSWAGPARHAWAEAGDRAGATWADFVDWLRLGR